MKCPVCPDTTLAMTNREGIEIDYCPNCRGVWLDRGELDKIIERSAAQMQVEPTSPQRNDLPPPRYDDDDDYRQRGYDHPYQKRKRRGLLGELFDFD